jgi:drug/metabolite transporter (DMT)-like permease
LALVMAIVAVSFAAIFFRLAQPTPPLVASAIRLTFAGLLLTPVVYRALSTGSLSRRSAYAALVGGLAYALHFGAWVSSLELTTIAASTTIVTTSPLWLTLYERFARGARAPLQLWMSLGLAGTGVVLIGGSDWQLSAAALRGDAFALLGAFAICIYLVVAQRHGSSAPALAFTGVAAMSGALALWIGAAASNTLELPPTAEAWGWLAMAALVPQLIGHTLLTWALRHAQPSVVATATVAEPVGSTLLAWWLLGETVPPLVALGCTLTGAAVVWGIRARRSM